jgi:DNA processing protein
LKRRIRLCRQEEAEQEFFNSKKFGAQILLFCEKNYPNLLREIPDPAPILTVKGNVDFFSRKIVAIVGPRNASFNAANFARKIAFVLGKNSIIISSGMARGIDCAAHEASIESGTIAIIAGGINHIYPKENSYLYEKIAERGLLVSETPFGVTPKGGNFVQRNRLISGISLGVVVVEAGLKSGSLITAKFAIEQGREVFAVPGSPFDPRCHGTNRLIKDGAKMVENIDDILEELFNLKANFSETILSQPQDYQDQATEFSNEDDVKKIRAEILKKLTFSPFAIEEIIRYLETSPRLVNIALVQLELADKVEINFGKVSLKSDI